MSREKKSMILERIDPLLKQLEDKEFRNGYLESHVKMFIAHQIRSMRGNQTQKEFAKKLGMTQSVVSRIENPEYGQVSIQTLLDIAKKLDIALLVRFASYRDFLEITSDFTENSQKPKPFNAADMYSMKTGLESDNAAAPSNVTLVINVMTNESHEMAVGKAAGKNYCKYIEQYA